ncbi:Cof-type HAD-IIB family hydrolase [Neobacillus kokaensis]|uniref:5-amino-6-(5-phospho-D-ribitylamino)uracil phosphatase YcsE n=1 Tax=Neobacillus kokaensis TaxID=2759023 RepID=A0ABQ3MVW5_9BACI|nr:Cof-type HAD-IIB family hydrolase [Neobacillus kokaensis]GHH96815.1 5-amino-6-(5-phospho-D-ribitylamino)uracil phosphatase YcsE [Neobacillus kokaensis]
MDLNNINIKLIALDMDGTLLRNNHEISEANRKAIKEAQEKGVKVVLSTGRSYQTCHPHADALGLDSYLVTVNGSEVWDENRQLIRRTVMKPEYIERMWGLAKQYKTSFWAINTERNWRDEMPEDLNSVEWMKFGFHINDEAALKTIYEQLVEGDEFELSNSAPNNIEVNCKGINKARGLELVCSMLGIEMNNVMAVGDSLNDLIMIKEAGIGVAMGNAQDTLKQAADWITSSNEEDGVAKAIRKWVLKQE